MHLVSVYGSLKKGHINHSLIHGSQYIGDETISGLKMYDLGLFPGVVKDKDQDNFVLVEVYEVSSETLKALDTLEGYDENDIENSFYKRITIRTQWGKTWFYLFNRNIRNAKEIISGSW